MYVIAACVGQSSRDDVTRQEVYVGDNITLNCLAKPNYLLAVSLSDSAHEI